MQRLYLLFTHAELGGEPNQKVMMVLKNDTSNYDNCNDDKNNDKNI